MNIPPAVLWGALVIALPLALFGLAFIVGCFEKHPVRMFNATQPFQLAPYSRAMLAKACGMGFVCRGHGNHTKFGDKLRALVLRSSDGYVMAIIGEGTILGMPSKKTILISRFNDDRTLLTVDEAGTGEIDDKTTRQIIMHADFEELVRKHYEKGHTIPGAVAFPPDAGWPEIDEIYRRRGDRIVARGLATYVDDTRETFRYSPAGSFRLTIVHGIGQVLKPANFWRTHKPRPS